MKNPEISEEAVPLDVLFVGAGPSGLCGAIQLAKSSQAAGLELEIGVLDKAQHAGGHTLSGAVLNPRVLKDLFPELQDKDFPFRNKVSKEKVYLLGKTKAFRVPTPPTMKNHGFHTASLCEVVRWLTEKAEALGVHVLHNFPASELLLKDGKVLGVRTAPTGLNRDGSQGESFSPGSDITANVTVLCEGTRGLLTQAYLEYKNISAPQKHVYALGVKEYWKVKQAPKGVIHTLGWPLENSSFGGSFLYPMGDHHVSLGIVVGLDYEKAGLDIHGLLQQLKTHPLFKKHLEGGELLEWGAKTLPEGGWNAIPEKLHGDGILIAGDAAGFINVPALKGAHYAMQSGVFAADTILEACKNKDFSSETLKTYDDRIKNSYIKKDLFKVRNMRQAFEGGLYVGAIKAILMTLTHGLFPGGNSKLAKEDAEKIKTPTFPKTNYSLSKQDAVYLSGNKTRDDIPSHLIAKDVPENVAKFYESLCPAGVYEWKNGKLIINAPNCVDCKATDVLGPRWIPREGGSGPNYQNM